LRFTNALYSGNLFISTILPAMPLKTYHKAISYTSRDEMPALQKSREHTFVLRSDGANYPTENNFTLWGMLVGGYELLKAVVASSSGAGVIIPSIFILSGVGFMLFQFVPNVVRDLRADFNFYEKGTTPVVDLGYIETKEQYVSNPGADYFQQLTDSARLAGGFFQDEESLNYRGTMHISIPSLNINNMPVGANIDGGNADNYNTVLETALAHFKGSAIPTSAQAGNTVIYGHSVGGSYLPRADDVVSAFTFLADLQVGDLIKLEVDGKTFNYRMQRSKIVPPEDTSVLFGIPGRSSLTLFTCWGIGPSGGPGNRSGRLVVTAVPV
jgi:LPXTG-site transpeptidase (sortase) family protein